MKKIVLLFAITIALFSNSNLKAQYSYEGIPDSTQYDLLYVFDTSYFSNCFLSNNNMYHRLPVYSTGGFVLTDRYAYMYDRFYYYAAYMRLWCNPDFPIIDGQVIGATISNDSVYAEGFAQEYFFDQYDIPYDDYIICGVSIRIGNNSLHDWQNFVILDENFDTLSSTLFHTFNLGPNMEEMVDWNRDGWNNYYFPQRDYARLTNLTNFHLAFSLDGEKYKENSYFYAIHTCNVYSPCLRDSIYANGGYYEVGLSYDTILPGLISWPHLYHSNGDFNNTWTFMAFKDSLTGEWVDPYGLLAQQAQEDFLKDSVDYNDYIPLCSFTNSKHIKRHGEWVDFVDDPAYTIWQNIYINMVPIIMIPSNTQSLPEVELEKMCYLMPNPANDYFKVMSHYTIKDIQVFDMVGKLLIEIKVNNFEKDIDIGNLSSGSYIVKINTAKGSAKKKLIVE